MRERSAGRWVWSGRPQGLPPVLSDPNSIGAGSLMYQLHYRSVVSAEGQDNVAELEFEYKLSPRDIYDTLLQLCPRSGTERVTLDSMHTANWNLGPVVWIQDLSASSIAQSFGDFSES